MKQQSLLALYSVLASWAIFIGCATQSRTLYNTLASVQATTSGAYSGYLDLVVQGKLTTNSVPVVSRDYTLFQGAWSSAVTMAAGGVTNPAPQNVTEASAKVLADITVAKGSK